MTFYIMTHICVCIKQREEKKKFHEANTLWPETHSDDDFLFSVRSRFINSDHSPRNWFHDPLNGFQSWKNITATG